MFLKQWEIQEDHMLLSPFFVQELLGNRSAD